VHSWIPVNREETSTTRSGMGCASGVRYGQFRQAMEKGLASRAPSSVNSQRRSLSRDGCYVDTRRCDDIASISFAMRGIEQ